jgi:hypothetical protein
VQSSVVLYLLRSAYNMAQGDASISKLIDIPILGVRKKWDSESPKQSRSTPVVGRVAESCSKTFSRRYNMLRHIKRNH